MLDSEGGWLEQVLVFVTGGATVESNIWQWGMEQEQMGGVFWLATSEEKIKIVYIMRYVGNVL